MAQMDSPAKRILRCVDLTNLDANATAGDVRDLTDSAKTPYGKVAAVCVLPAFVKQAHASLIGTGVKTCTVVNFPGGNHPAKDVIALTKEAVADGAEEIDVVIPWRMLLEGHPENVAARVARVKAAADGAPVKAIIESGMLRSNELIQQATHGAVDGGADFVSTSTGMAPANGTPEAARAIVAEIQDCHKDVGLKASGGVNSVEAALSYFSIAEEMMGDGWVTTDRFRIGGTGILSALITSIGKGI